MLPKKYQKFKHLLKVKKSKTGLGLYTNSLIKRGDFIIEYTGSVYNLKEADARGGKYLFETNKNRYIDGSNRKNIARYINHSCKPNSEVEIRSGRILVFAKRSINPGEELNYDYGKEYFNQFIKPYGCKCANCKSKF